MRACYDVVQHGFRHRRGAVKCSDIECNLLCRRVASCGCRAGFSISATTHRYGRVLGIFRA